MANITISGKVVDQNNNPISVGSVIFVDGNGMTVAAATTDSVGRYQTSIPTGEYTITADGPHDIQIDEVALKNQTLSNNSERNFTLAVPAVMPAALKKSNSFSAPVFIVVVLFIAILCAGAGFVMWKRRKLPQASGSH